VLRRPTPSPFALIAVVICLTGAGSVHCSDPAEPLNPTWERALLSDRSLVHLMKAEDRSETDLVRWVQRLERLTEEPSEWISTVERRSLCLDLWQTAVRKTWVRRVLAPSVVIPPDEIEAEYRRTRQSGLDRAKGVKVLEIFLWAPDDLPDLRRARLDLARSIREIALTPDLFTSAAEEFSDATSFYKGGRIGTVHADRVDARLNAVLFTGRTGPTEILETEDGVYLFFVAAEVKARTHDPEAVRGRIENGFRSERVRSILPGRIKALAADLDGQLTLPTPVGLDDPAFTIHGNTFLLGQVLPNAEPDPATRGPAIQLSFEAQLMAADLCRAEVPVPPEDSPECTLAVAHAIVDAMTRDQKERSTALEPESVQHSPAQSRTLKLWSFDALFISPVDTQNVWFRVFRAVRSSESSTTPVDLESIAEELATIDPPVTVRIERYRDVPPSDVAGLGPEIHTSLRRYLEPGDPPRVLHLAADRQAAVVFMLDSKERTVVEAPASGHRQQERRRNEIRRAIYRRVLDGEKTSDSTPPTKDRRSQSNR